MTREELTYKFLESKKSNYILQLPTGFGKTRLALQKVDQWYTEDCKILIVVPFLIVIKNWKEEIEKWGYNKILANITFSTYISLPKYCDDTEWDIVVYDEVHHTSERCRNAMKHLNAKHFIGLSATLKKDHIDYLKNRFNPEIISVRVKDAIDSNVLPDPKIILIPMVLDNFIVNCIIEKNIKKNTSSSTIKTIGYSEKWKYRTYKGPLRITCTARQYYDEISGLIEWYKQKGMYNAVMKNIWLHKAGERLKWLAKCKENIIKDILKQLKNYRVLTFCQSIEQSETLGCPCVNSKVGTENLEKFNAKKIKHIASIDMLNEGLNPVDCKIGLFQMINSSQRVSLQRIGRILRHKEPILIFPYWVHTREEEIINELIKDYNPELIYTISTTNSPDIKNYV